MTTTEGLRAFLEASEYETSLDLSAWCVDTASDEGAHAALLVPFLRQWQALRDAKDFAAADALKSRLEGAGLKLSVKGGEASAEVLPEFDEARLEGLA